MLWSVKLEGRSHLTLLAWDIELHNLEFVLLGFSLKALVWNVPPFGMLMYILCPCVWEPVCFLSLQGNLDFNVLGLKTPGTLKLD